MIKKEDAKEPQEASKDDVLTRRAAMKRIAIALGGAGVVIVAGRICKEREASAAYFDQGYSAYVSFYRESYTEYSSTSR